MKNPPIVCLLLYISHGLVAHAGDMETLVVTGTRAEISQAQSPVSIDVISAAQLQQVSQGTLASALNYIPGIVTKRNAKDGYTVQMQGFDGDHVLVLLDSQPLISPTGAAVDLDQISVVDIERIEVLRGAASVLYGSSAMGGVINIISRKQRKNRLTMHYQGSSYANNAIDSGDIAHQLQLDVNQQLGVWHANLNLQKIDDPGFDYDATSLAQSAPSNDKSFVNVGLSRQLNDITLGLKSRYLSEDKYKVRYALPGQNSNIGYLSKVNQWQQDVSLSQAQWWKVQGRYIQHNETSGDSNGLRDADITLAEIDSQYQWSLDSLDFISGLVLHRDELYQEKHPNSPSESATIEIDNKSRNSVEAYTQAGWQWDEHSLLAGIRVQQDSDFGWHSALRINSLYNLASTDDAQWQFRAGVGQSYRVPTLKERFYIFDHSNLGYMVLGNPELQPETALSSNLEVSYQRALTEPTKHLSLSANLHYSKANDFIATLTDVEASSTSGLLISRYYNINQAYIKGLDLTAKLNWGELDYQLSYSFLHATNNKSEHLSDRPTHQIKANVNWQLPYDFNALAYLVYESGEYPTAEQVGVARDHWTSLNLNISQQFNQNWRWNAGIDNVFDNHQNSNAIAAGLLDVRPLSSRRIFVGMSYQFY
ncbi:TonB-dependent siderophore receptor [Paraglaciecola sp.]|uniref:TonB-dependent receptor plug domain-containing protein n=1 Tax=Paraglaciecola sp. TaxID=1920173 RepID=UPI00273D9B6B|nr:TonB-dependent receptor [Paraglaciecola sp.]MDP5029637.1 TonB-dependent receptor [Paraglaciecola sp.]